MEITAKDFGLLEIEPENWDPKSSIRVLRERIPEYDMTNPGSLLNLYVGRTPEFDTTREVAQAAQREIREEEDARIFEALDAALGEAPHMPLTARAAAEFIRNRVNEDVNEDAIRRYIERWSNPFSRRERIYWSR